MVAYNQQRNSKLIDGPNQLPYTPLEAVQLLLDELQGAIDKIVNDDLSSLSQNNANQVKDTSDHSSINDSIDKITKFNTIKNIIKNIKDSWANKTNLEIEKLISAIETLESVSNKSLAKATIDAKFIIGQLQRYLDNTQFEWQSKEYDINKLTKIKENLRIIFSWDPKWTELINVDKELDKFIKILQTIPDETQFPVKKLESLLEIGQYLSNFFGQGEWFDNRIDGAKLLVANQGKPLKKLLNKTLN